MWISLKPFSREAHNEASRRDVICLLWHISTLTVAKVSAVCQEEQKYGVNEEEHLSVSA